MKHFSRLWASGGWLGVALVAMTACGDSGSGEAPPAECEPGTERCACYGNETCNDGLDCLSGLCVDPTPGGGADGAGGARSGGAGGARSGGTSSSQGGSGDGGQPDATGGSEPGGGSSGTPATGGSENGGEAPSGGTGPSDGGEPPDGAVCGDGDIEGSEACDDGNTDDGDGCSAECELENPCPNLEECESECGDGAVELAETCDDGNTDDGDGCSADCQVEGTRTCGATTCDADGCRVTLPALFRDFNPVSAADGHPDFDPPFDSQEAITGLVEDTLSEDGKPVFSGLTDGNISSEASFDQWYRDTPDVNTTIQGGLVLFDDGGGGFVNRYGENGEQWKGFPGTLEPVGTLGRVAYCSSTGCDDAACLDVPAGEECFFPCEPWGPVNGAGQACLATVSYYDGNPLFFPIDASPDALPGTRYAAQIAPDYGFDWTEETSGALHDFYFTTEIRFSLEYDEARSVNLQLLGDDDLWVFVNGRLALDLGGWHVPLGGSVTVDAGGSAAYGLVQGEPYEIAIFHAERALYGSTLLLRLSGVDSESYCVEAP